MTKRTMRSNFGFALFPLLLVIGCGGEAPDGGWTGTVDTLSNGAVRVANPATGLWEQAEPWRLVPELAIGKIEGADAEVFSSISGLEADAEGRVYVLDRQANELRIFSPEGVHIRSVGRSGGGPGEYANVNGLEWITEDTLLVIDQQGNRYTLLTKEGEYTRSVPRHLGFYGWVFKGGLWDGRVYEVFSVPVGEERYPALLGTPLRDGFGGYPTVPPMLAAARAKVPTIVHDQNAVLGRANRFLAKRMTTIATAFDRVKGAEEFVHRVVETGNPVRAAVLDAAKVPYPERQADEPFNLLVFGGSQGARFLSELMPSTVRKLAKEIVSQLRITQQCRPEDLDRVARTYKQAGVAAELRPFFDDMPSRIAQSHLVVSRSGASTVAELAVIGRPAIMVPLPHALDQDQKANAAILARAGGGWMVEQRDMSADRLAGDLGELIAHPERLAAAAAAAKSVGRPDAVERLADLVERVAAGKSVKGEAAA